MHTHTGTQRTDIGAGYVTSAVHCQQLTHQRQLLQCQSTTTTIAPRHLSPAGVCLQFAPRPFHWLHFMLMRLCKYYETKRHGYTWYYWNLINWNINRGLIIYSHIQQTDRRRLCLQWFCTCITSVKRFRVPLTMIRLHQRQLTYVCVQVKLGLYVACIASKHAEMTSNLTYSYSTDIIDVPRSTYWYEYCCKMLCAPPSSTNMLLLLQSIIRFSLKAFKNSIYC